MREIKKPSELTKEELIKFVEWLDVFMSYSDEQFEALEGKREMTYELFRSCLDVACKNPTEFFKIIDAFPEMAEIFNKEIDTEIEELEKWEPTEEEKKWLEESDKRMRKFFREHGIMIGDE